MYLDHPRRCGENRLVLTFFPCGLGSPPQVRGKQRNFILHIGAARITPAGAGKTCRKATLASASRDHPRRCGENDVRLRKFDPVPGSPPQVRGKQVRTRTNAFCNRITPAGAGKTCLCWALRRNYWDHPRRCGENWAWRGLALTPAGSPPQVRGKQSVYVFRQLNLRITPAGAGKTAPGKRQPFECRDHPRRCGENPTTWGLSAYCPGSPPQVRGKLL